MAFACKLCVAILSCVLYVQADVSHLGYSRYTGQRVQPLRLQRLESSPTPYPSAGYRPNREFHLPLFPASSNHQSNRPQHSSGFDSLSEPQRPQRPQLVYGAPEPRFRQQPRFPQQPQQNVPQNSNGFNNFAEPQQPEFVDQSQFSQGNKQTQNNFNNFDEPQQPQNNHNDFNNFARPQQPQNNDNSGFNNLAEPQQRPELLYGAPQEQQPSAQTGSDILSEAQQRPEYNYNIPSAQLRQLLVAKLQQAARLQQQVDNQGYRQTQAPSQSQRQQQRQFANSPETLYLAPTQQQTQIQSQAQAESQISQKPARLTDNREDREDDTDAKTSETLDIETTSKSDEQKTANQAAATPAVAAAGLYYPAAAFSYVQPFSAAYVAAANYQTVQPAYNVASPFLPQQYALAAAAPAQLQAW